MLPLDSPRWAELNHAYGDASDVPACLSAASAGDEEAVDELRGMICHQGSVYSASFAAVPHLVDIAKRTTEPNARAEVLILVGHIASSQDDRSRKPIPADLMSAYQAALPDALTLALSTLAAPLEGWAAVYLMETAAGLNGFSTLGRVLHDLVDNEFVIECPSCGRELYVWPNGDDLSTAAEDPVHALSARRTPVLPGPAPGSPREAQLRWLMQNGGAAALAEIGQRLPALFGSGTSVALRALSLSAERQYRWAYRSFCGVTHQPSIADLRRTDG